MVEIRTDGLVKRFGRVIALDKVSLKIKHGELFTVLGPSGCGKTTFLRTVAGFEMPDEGRIFFDGVDITDVPAHKRGAGMVFQSYALWPHMTIYDNVAYGLKIKKLPKEEIDRKVREALKLVKLEGLEKRNPYQLSGGQQQRVAVARVLVTNPRVLLLDEPLSNLDAKLRIEMRGEVKKLQKSLGITTVYVTHDQEEAMSISDRIAIMNQGRIEQVGTPTEIYFRPRNTFVADFIGQGTFIPGRVTGKNEYLKIELETGHIVRALPSDPTNPPDSGERVLVTIRPESFKLGEIKNHNVFKCKVDTVFFLGRFKRVKAESRGHPITIEIDPTVEVSAGEELTISVHPSNTLAVKD